MTKSKIGLDWNLQRVNISPRHKKVVQMAEVPPMAMKFLRQRVSLRHLRLILALDEERSITRTADRLCISQACFQDPQ